MKNPISGLMLPAINNARTEKANWRLYKNKNVSNKKREASWSNCPHNALTYQVKGDSRYAKTTILASFLSDIRSPSQYNIPAIAKSAATNTSFIEIM